MAEGAATSVQIKGLAALIRALKEFPEDVEEEFVDELEEAASPAKKTAMTLMHELSNVKDPYDTFKIGVSRGEKRVWLAPAWPVTGQFPHRPKFITAVLQRERKAVDQERENIINKIDEMLDRIADHHGF